MEYEFKILIDTNVLVSASISQLITKLECKLQHHFYEISKPLFDYLKAHIDKRIGIFTPEIENSAKEVLTRAIDSEIKIHKEKEALKQLEIYSFILRESIFNLAKNMEILVREPINEKAVNKITYRVTNFYYNLQRKLEEKNPEKVARMLVNNIHPKMKGLARGIFREQESKKLRLYFKLARKFEEEPPDIKDIRILSQAVYFHEKKIYGEKTKILLTSTDYHFSKIRIDEELNDFVPKSIYKILEIYCDWPDEILKILKNEKELPNKENL